VNDSDARATWRGIRADVLESIRDGRWKPGGLIPKEVELAATYGCTRSTVARALRDLAAAGFLERRRKGGTRVAPNPVRKALLEIPLLEEGIRQLGKTPGRRLDQAAMVVADAPVCAELGVPAGSRLFLVRCLYLADQQPHQYEVRWINPAAAPGIQSAELSAQGVDQWLLAHAPFNRARITVRAVAAGPDLASALQVPVGAPLLCMTRLTWRRERPLGLLDLYYHPALALSSTL
jgi:GntR family transcriptional regulator, histidine utilization repressor